MTWQPIETAPRDGTIVDLWCKCSVTDKEYQYRATDCAWKYHHWLNGKPVGDKTWWDRDRFYIPPTPTHWMARPEGPSR
jgi:hypothetical protein